jgi:hypothetical protein
MTGRLALEWVIVWESGLLHVLVFAHHDSGQPFSLLQRRFGCLSFIDSEREAIGSSFLASGRAQIERREFAMETKQCSTLTIQNMTAARLRVEIASIEASLNKPKTRNNKSSSQSHTRTAQHL